MMARTLEQILEVETPGVVAEAAVKAQAMLLGICLGDSSSGDKTQADTVGALEHEIKNPALVDHINRVGVRFYP